MGAACALARRVGPDDRVFPRGHGRAVSSAVAFAAKPLRLGLWGAAIAVLGLAVALPEQSFDVVLGVAAAGATALALIQPMVALPLLLFAVPFGGVTRGSTTSGDTSSDLSFGAAE